MLNSTIVALVFDTLDPWEELSGGTFANSISSKLFDIGANWYSVVFWIGVVGLSLSLMTTSLSLMLKKKGSDAAIAKESFTTKVIIAVIIFAFPTLFGLLYPVFESLGSL